MSYGNPNPISATKALESLTGIDHQPSESAEAERAELDREELRELEHASMGMHAAPARQPTGFFARLARWLHHS